ncbi:MAG: hypothetical protein ACRD4T_12275, partial [Candidatus Acidiferrales bacterium]
MKFKNMTGKIHLLFVAVLALAVAPLASAQSTEPVEVTYHWGAIHKGPGQALAINFSVPDSADRPAPLPVEFQLTDKNGRVLYSNTIALPAVQSFAMAFVAPSEIKFAKANIEADIYALIDPNVRTLVPSFRVQFPAGTSLPAVQFTATLEV